MKHSKSCYYFLNFVEDGGRKIESAVKLKIE